MLKRAITVFAFSMLLFSCATRMTYEPPQTPPEPFLEAAPPPISLLPDLTISDISLSESGHVMITITNVGKGPVPHHVGNLAVYVDGSLKSIISLGDLPDQAFLEPGGATSYTTSVELREKHQVTVQVDNDHEILEENEFNNLFAKVLGAEIALLPPVMPPSPPSEPKPEISPEPILRPDISITDLFLNPQKGLVITIGNEGNSPFPLRDGSLRIFMDGKLKEAFPLVRFSDQPFLQPKESIAFTTSLSISGRHEVEALIDQSDEIPERDKEKKKLKKVLEGLPLGPDIVIKDLNLTEDLELTIILSNAGEGDLRKGATLRIRILMNDQKVSEFDHLVSESLRTNFGNRYVVAPPYRVGISGNSRVRVSIWPKSPFDDIRLENNTLERNFIIYPFRIEPRKRQEFFFSVLPRRHKDGSQGEKVKAEVRWEGGGYPLRVSVRRPQDLKDASSTSGRSPLQVEIPFSDETGPRGNEWIASVTNLMKRRVEGHLIVQHP